ncbi:F420-dependent oxidoreductase [Actinophytocola xinjiangensis]|uniref:F420-dependent oxidoreductase n=1 Tax=Actinophytocola xinjiangensis TaxID=485602 RepID=A0A7Z0WRR5_9PSEU|nr:LLM class F420-dependent oxidoreductase [Actinophytocola xinjiangensis]OLF12752.1 F420-dependent oxidoreductase [Actinophytocola xinjiangensis]
MTQRPHRPFRFAVNLMAPASRDEWVAKCRKAEALGFDVIVVPDHLGMPAPFPALVAAAEATERPRLGTLVINTSFYNPALLARDIAGTDQLTDGRLELGLGAGYVKAEFDEAGLPFASPGKRIDHLERTVTEVRRLLADPAHEPRPAQKPIPLLLAGRGDRMLRLAARHADIITFSGVEKPARDGELAPLATAARVAERIRYAQGLLGERAREVELNFPLQMVRVTNDRRAAVAEWVDRGGLSVEELLEIPGMLVGTVAQIADQLRHTRETLGVNYVTALEPDMEDFAKVIAELR